MRVTTRSIAIAALTFLAFLPTAFADSPPDIVRRRDGGMLRGTIEELDPKGTVTVLLPSGERRVVEMKDVEYAGPADKSPTAPTAPAARPSEGGITITTEGAQVGLTSDEPDLTFHVRATEGVVTTTRGVGVVRGYARLCTAPCSAQLPAGTYSLGLSKGDGSVVEADPITLRGPSTLRGSYQSRQGTRTAGVVVVAAGGVLAAVLIATASHSHSDCSSGYCIETSEMDVSQAMAGIAVLAASGVLGLVLATRRDIATISVSPGVGALGRERGVGGLEGLTLRASF